MGKRTKLKSEFELISEAIEEALESPRKIRRFEVEMPDPAPEFGAGEVRRVREALKFSQHVFAHVLNVSPKTVQAWEQGGRKPDGAARRLLQIIAAEPSLFTRIVDGKLKLPRARKSPAKPSHRRKARKVATD